jgi:hypothetical protein
MKQDEITRSLESFESELQSILSRFSRSTTGIHIQSTDHSRFKEIVIELRDLFIDEFARPEDYLQPLESYFNASLANYTGAPSYRGVEDVRGVVTAALTRVRRNPLALKQLTVPAAAQGHKDPDDIIRIAERLHLVARQLRERHDQRPTLEVEDEYDVQDLVHSLLVLYFDDIRKEEWVPSYAGGAARMDFLVPELETVVEIKKSRQSLTTKQLGEQLIVDIARYKRHPQCRMLLCIVYDPEGRVGNPRGVESDLNREDPEMAVRVMIVPKGL